VEPPQVTLIGCEPEAAAVEARFLAALENATRFELEATSLVLRDDEGAAQVTFRPRA
jgi:heat shock protein HslJ